MNGQQDPFIDDFFEKFIAGQSAFHFNHTIGPDEAAYRLASMHVGEFMVRAVTLGILRIHTSTARLAADLVLGGNTAWMQGAEFQQLTS
ncbi:MAG: hypothetical protein PHY82_11985 [Lentisphaeria bacterium]|nr:hypothetical protein [Lentisphaeria bacterium]